ncbi:MAG: DeoR/GlpR family DNA-binding transcription regulator [Streptococcaceae bacterium]|nr:DeoR/GlpR family DNA-binding transcription regulator [Streptococcaceae bacterium]
MKKSYAEIGQRRNELLDFIAKEELSYAEIAARLHISIITLRRDLLALEQMGKIKRQRGKSTVKDYLSIDENLIDEIEIIKRKIGQKAACLIENNKTVFINSGSTPLYSLNYLKNKQVTIITNNVRAARSELNPKSHLILSGGEIQYPKASLIGDFANEFFSSKHADFAIIGVYGISPTGDITSPNFAESRVNNTIINQTTGPVIVVADYRKIGLVSNFISGKVSKISYIITDTYADQAILKEFEKIGITVIQITP